MALYKYVFNQKHGDLNAHVFDENGREIWKVRYPDYYEDEESGELIEDDTLFDRGYMKSVYDVDGLEGYLKKINVLQKDDQLFSESEWEEHYEEEYAEGGGINLLTESEEKEYRQLYRLYLLAYKVYFSIQKSSLSESSKMYEDDYWYYEYDKADRELEYFVDDLKDKYEGKEEQLKHELSLIQNEVIEEVESETKMADGGEVKPNTEKLLGELRKHTELSREGSVSISKFDGKKYRYDTYTLKYPHASNWLVNLFEKAAEENGKKYARQFSYLEKYSFYYDRPEFKNRPNGKMSYTELVFLNADGGVMDVRMEDTVQRMDDPHFADISYYAKGGSLEAKIKKLLVDKQSFDLPLEMAVYVPSTEKANQIIPKRDFARRIEDVQVYLSQLFGGFSSVDVEGGYESSEKGLIQEDVTKVVAFANRDGFEDKFNQLMNRIVAWCKAWSQESIGFEFEGDLFYVSENAKFEEGGEVDDLKSKVELVLKKNLPNFYTFVKQYREPLSGDTAFAIMMSASDHEINRVRGQYPQVVSLYLNTRTLELHPQVFGGNGGQSIYRKPDMNDPKEKYYAMKNVKIPFRTPPKNEESVLKAIDNFSKNYKKALIDNKDVLMYQDIVDYNKILK